jgi:hypothetical protein
LQIIAPPPPAPPIPPIPADPLELLLLLLLELDSPPEPPAPAVPLDADDDVVVVFGSGSSPHPTIDAALAAATPAKSTADKIEASLVVFFNRITPSFGPWPKIQGKAPRTSRYATHDASLQGLRATRYPVFGYGSHRSARWLEICDYGSATEDYDFAGCSSNASLLVSSS